MSLTANRLWGFSFAIPEAWAGSVGVGLAAWLWHFSNNATNLCNYGMGANR